MSRGEIREGNGVYDQNTLYMCTMSKKKLQNKTAP